MLPERVSIPATGWVKVDNKTSKRYIEVFNDGDNTGIYYAPRKRQSGLGTHWRRIPANSQRLIDMKTVYLYNSSGAAVIVQVEYIDTPSTFFSTETLDAMIADLGDDIADLQTDLDTVAALGVYTTDQLNLVPRFKNSPYDTLVPPDIVGTEMSISLPFVSAQGGYLGLAINMENIINNLANSDVEIYLKYITINEILQKGRIWYDATNPANIEIDGTALMFNGAIMATVYSFKVPEPGDAGTYGGLELCITQNGVGPDIAQNAPFVWHYYEGLL